MKGARKGNLSRGQMQMGETIFAVFFIIIIIGIGLIAYSNVQQGKLEDMRKRAQDDRVVALAHSMSGWPELMCSVRESPDPNCMDTAKIEVLGLDMNQAMQNTSSYAFQHYTGMLGKAEVSISQIYPSRKEWVIYNNTQGLRSREAIDVPVSLFDPLTQRYSLGVVTIHVYG